MHRKKSNNFCVWLLQFYRNHLKTIPGLHPFFLFLYPYVWPIVARLSFWHAFLISWSYYKVIKIAEFESIYALSKTTIFPEERLAVKPTLVLPKRYQGKLETKALGVFPEIRIVEVPHVEVVGASNIVFSRNFAITHNLLNLKTDYLSEEMHLRYKLSPRLGLLIRRMRRGRKRAIPFGANFTDACASNYAHWLTEVLPRIYVFAASGLRPEVKMIIDRGLHPNMMESLYVIAGKNPNIFKLGRDRTVKVENLMMASCAGYVPFDRRKKSSNHSHGSFSPAALGGMVNQVRSVLGAEVTQKLRKLYVRRNSKARSLINADEIELLLLNLGFEVVEPEKMTFSQQAKLFSEASMVVGATGAAMANLIFCNRDARVIVLMGIHRDMPYSYWRNMGSAVGVHVDYVLGEITSHKRYGIHGDFLIDPHDLLNALQAERNCPDQRKA